MFSFLKLICTDSDNNPKITTISYEQAAGVKADGDARAADGKVAVPKVNNVYGSTAGAGSGDFHAYRKARRAEIFRVEAMTKQAGDQSKLTEFQQRVQAHEMAAEAKTKKNADKRRMKKLKARALREQHKAAKTVAAEAAAPEESVEVDEEEVARLAAAVLAEAEKSITAAVPFSNDGSYFDKIQASHGASDSPATEEETNKRKRETDDSKVEDAEKTEATAVSADSAESASAEAPAAQKQKQSS